MVVDPRFEWRQESRRHQVPWDQAIGLRIARSRLHQAASQSAEKTAAARSPWFVEQSDVISYIKALGVTSVELLPIFTFVNDRLLLDKGRDRLLGVAQTRSDSSLPIRAMRSVPQPW